MKEKFFINILKHKFAVFLIIILFSITGYFLSGQISQGVFPNVFFPRIQVTIENGYTPMKQMLFQVTKPSEEKLKSVQGVEKIVSSTSVGSTEINMYFNWNTDPYIAYQFVNSSMAEIKNEIPPEAKISIIQATPSRYPVSIYAIGSDILGREKLTDTLFYKIKPYLLSIPGIYNVEIIAPEWEEYKLIFSLKKLKEYNLDIETIVKTLKSQDNINFLGLINDYQKQYVLSLYQKAETTKDIINLKIPVGTNNYVSLSDIATLIKGSTPITKTSIVSGYKNAVIFNILRQPNANSIDVEKEVKEKIAELNNELKSEHISINNYYDETVFIKKSVRGVIDAVVLGTIITTIIVFMFLRKVKLSLFLLLIVPTVFLITIIGIKIGKFDFNIFTLGGMAAAVGGLIDHIIIVIESIEKHHKESGDKLTGVIKGSIEILPTMTVATIISILLFVPLLLVSGVVGVFFKQLAFVIISTYIISQIIAVFFTPIVAFITLPDKHEQVKKDLFDKFVDLFLLILKKSMKISWLSIPFSIVIIFLLFNFYQKIPSTFLPKWDEGGFVVDITLAPGTSLETTKKEFADVGKIINGVDEVKNWSVRVGATLGSVSAQSNVGDMTIILKEQRKKDIFQIKDEVRNKINSKFANFEEFDLPQILEDRLADILGEETPITVLLFGSNPDKLILWGEKLKENLRKSDILEEVNLKTSYTSPSINIKIKPEAESIYGIDSTTIINQINILYYGQLVSSITEGEKIIGVRLISNSFDRDPIQYLKNNLSIFSVKANQYIPLIKVADIIQKQNEPEINHYNLSPVSLITLRFKGNDMSLAVNKVREEINKLKLPTDITSEIGGFYKEQQKSFNEMLYVISFAILIVFISLLLEFNNLIIVTSILIGLILTLFGVFSFLMLTNKPLDITGFMGMMIVLSIVINNNILIFHDYQKFLLDKKSFEDKKEAIITAVGSRTRPIIMTMLSNVFALLPIAMAFGEGTQLIQNMAISIMGGLSMAILVNLVIIPLLFIFLSNVFSKNHIKSLNSNELIE